MMQVYHIVLDDEDQEVVAECAKDANMSPEEWVQWTADWAISQKLTPEKEKP